MYSIRKKLTLTIVIGMVLILSMTTMFLYYLIAREVQQVYDSALLDKARGMMSLTELDVEDGLEFDFTEGMMPEFEAGPEAQYYQVWQHGNKPLIKSPSLKGSDLAMQDVALGGHRFADLRLLDGRLGRLVAVNFLPRLELEEEIDLQPAGTVKPDLPEPQPITLVLARERAALDEMLLSIALLISTIMLLVLAVCGIMVRGFVGKGLAPLSNLAQQVEGIDESSLGTRLSQQGLQSIEIAPIRDQVNHLLDRLQAAFEREKRFSSNVAHELRTPLAELRTLAEVGKMVPEDRQEVIGFFNDVNDVSRQMENIVITLLELARSDAGLLESHPEDILLQKYCDQVWRQAVNGQARGRLLVSQIPADLVVHTDREKLGMILGNLFTNAVSYSAEAAEVLIDTEVIDGNITLRVRNATADLKSEDIVHMKDRFWRKKKTRDDIGHAGLGLSLVEALARLMHLSVQLQLDHQRMFLVKISGFRSAKA